MQTMPKEALPLLRKKYAVCNTEPYAEFVAKLSEEGPLIAVQCGKDFLLIPLHVWEAVQPDISGIEREIAHDNT